MNSRKSSRVFTCLISDLAEEFKAKPILLNIFSEEDFVDESSPKTEETSEKAGFFKKLFRKK